LHPADGLAVAAWACIVQRIDGRDRGK